MTSGVVSGEKLYIKVADLLPKFTFLGSSLDEALKLQNEHDELLRQIQNMPTPLEEFYRKIQEKIASNERPNPTLIEEMAASLNAVWHDIKQLLAERREIVALNVAFFERLGEAYGKMSSLEVACNDTMIPIEAEAVREVLESFAGLRGEMLGGVAATLKAGQQMLERLRVLTEIGTLDSRPNHIKLDAIQASGQVEAWLEDLSNRRNQLEQAWISRKTQLEQCLTLAILARQLDEIEQCLARVRGQNLSSFTLGESAEQAATLLETYRDLKPEAALLRDKSLKITKTTEELLTSGCFAGDEACAKAYAVLSACTEHLEEIDHRETLLAQSHEFFTRAAAILKRLDQLELEVAASPLRPASPNDLPTHQKLLQDLRETIGAVLQMGYSLVDDVGRTKPEVAGVQTMIERIEQRKLHFERYCNEESERNVRTAQALNEFFERYGQLYAWLEEARDERIVRGSGIHRMGENLPEAKDCLLLHHQFLNDLEIKGNAINNLLVRLTPSLEHLGDEQRDDVQRKIDLIRQQWIALKNCVIERVDLLKLYIRFHQEAETLRNQFDAHAIQFATFKDNPADHSLILAAIANIRQTLENLRPLGAQCLDQLQQNGDAYLQKTRAAQCVERTLAEFADRQSVVSNEWESWNSRRRTETTLKEIMAANMETLAVASKLEEQLYPIFSTALDNPADLIEFIGRKRNQLQEDVKVAEADLTQRFDTIAQLELAGADAGTEQDIVAVKNNLNSIKTKLHSLGADFGELSDATERFLRSIAHCRDGIREYFGTKQAVTGPGSVEAIAEGYEQFKQATMEHFRGLLQQSEQIIERVKALEPPGARELDTDKIITLLENLRTYFESQTESENCELKKQHSVLAFDRELGDVRAAIRAEADRLERGRGQYGDCLADAQTARVAFEERAGTLQDLERRIDAFIGSGTELVRQYPETSPYIESETHKIRNEWTDLLRKLEDHRQLYSIAIEYFELITTIEEHYRTLNAELINASNKLTILNNLDVANDLVAQSFDVQTIDEEQYLQEPQVPLVIQTVEEQVHEQIHEVVTTTTSSTTQLQPSLRVVQPLADVSVQEGQRVRLQCVIDGTPDPTIEWYKNGISVQGNPDYRTSFDPASGVCTLAIDETVTADSADILCRAANEAGIADTKAKLLVTEAPPPPPKPAGGIAPTFAMRLLDGGVAQEGQPFQYDCVVAGGQPTPSVHWYKGEQCIDGSADYRQSYDAASGVASLRIEQVYLEDQTRYTCRVVNECGSDETSAFLTVKPLEPTEFPDFPEPLSNVMARVGQKIRLEAKVSGTPQPELMWTHDGKHFTNREVKFHYENGRAQLVIDEAFLKDAGVYTLTAKNIAGEKCCTCNVVVKGRVPNETSDSELGASDMEPVKPAVQLPLRDVSVFEGKPVRLDCVIVGQPEPEVIWYHGERPVKESHDFQLLFQGDRCSLVIREAYLEDAGEYRVVAINSAGEASSQCAVLVTPLNTAEPAVRQQVERVVPVVGAPPRFERLLSDILADEGERVQFECAVSGDPCPTIRWYVNNREIPTDVAISPRVHCVVREDGVVKLIIERVLPDDKGVYTVKAANAGGEAKCFSNLIVKTVNAPEFEAVSTPAFLTETQVCPTFRELFADRVVRRHEPTKFECIVIGKPQPKIRWFFNDQPVQGHDFLVSTSGDRQVLTIPEVRPELTGKITCLAENEAGNAQCVAIVQLLDQLGSTPAPEPTTALPTTESMQQVDLTGSSCVTLQKHVTTSSSVSSYSSSSMATVQQNGHSEVHAESAKHDRSFHQVGDQTPQVAEATEHQRYDRVNDQPATVQHEAASYVGVAPSHESIIANSGQISTGKPARRNMAPRFVTPFNGKIVDQGADVLLEGIVDGYPAPDVQVTKNDVPLEPDGDRIKVAYSLNKIVVELRNVSPLDAGRYTATASNAAGACTSTADLVVKKSIFPPVFGRRLQAQTARNGDRIVLDVEVSGTPEPSVAWYRDGRPVQEALVPGSYALQQVGPCFKLIFEQVSLGDTGKYTVVATNAGGEAQSTADIAVLQCESAPQPQPAAHQKHVSFVDMVQQQQPRSVETSEGEGGRFCARQEYTSEASLHGPTTESTIVTETRRTTEATMRMEHKMSFPDLPPVRVSSQRTQTPTVMPTVVETGTSPMVVVAEAADRSDAHQSTGTNTEPVVTRTDATQTPTTAQRTEPTAPPPTVATVATVARQPPAQSESKRVCGSISSSEHQQRPKSFEPLLQPANVTDPAALPKLVGAAGEKEAEGQPARTTAGMKSYPPAVEALRVGEFLTPQPETIPTPPIGALFRSDPPAPRFPPTARPRSTSPRPSADALAMERLWAGPKSGCVGSKPPGGDDEPPVCQVYHRQYRPPPTSSTSTSITKHFTQQQQQAQQHHHHYSTLPFARKQTKPPSTTSPAQPAKARSDSIRSDFQPIYQQPPPPQSSQQPPTQMYSSYASTQQFQASSTLSQQQYSQSAMQYQPFKASLAVEAPPPTARAPSPAPLAQSFPPKMAPFKPAPVPAPAMFTPTPAPAPQAYNNQPVLAPQPYNNQPAPSCHLTPIAGATPAFVAGPSYNQTPQPFKPLPPPSITPSSFGGASTPVAPPVGPVPEPAPIQQQQLPLPPVYAPEPTGPPTVGYAPKASSERKSSYYREQIEQSLLESMDKEPERVPAGGVKIIPPSPRKKSKQLSPPGGTVGQSDTAGSGAPAPLDQPAEPQPGLAGCPKSPFTATESEYESDLDGETVEESKTSFLVNNDLPEDLQPVKVLPTEEPLPTLKHVPVPAAVQPVQPEPTPVPAAEPTPVEQPLSQPQPQLYQPEPIAAAQQNGYPTPSPAQPFPSDYESDAGAAQPLAGYKPVHPVFAPPKQEFATGPAAPPPSSVPAQYYTSVTAQPVHSTIATETSNSLHMKETTESSNRVLNMQQTKRVVSLEHQNQQQFGVQKPGRFTPGEYRDSDGYDSDGNRIRPLWTPNPSDSDEPHYRSVRPNFQQPRSTSLPRQYERIQTPMEFDTLPVQMPSRIALSAAGLESNHQRSSSLTRQSTQFETTTTTTTETLKTQTLDRYASKRLATTPVPNTRDDMAVKAHRVAPINYIQKQAQTQADGMAQTFKTKAYHFSNEVMTDIKKTPIKPILKNAYGAPMPQQQQQQQQQYQQPMAPQAPQAPATAPQVYREESRVSQYGTKHVDPDTGIIYFKYDFGYEFGIIFPGEGHRIVAGRAGSGSRRDGGDGRKHPRYLNSAQFAAGDIEVPVQHERTATGDTGRPACNGRPTNFQGPTPYGVRSASVPATEMHASARYGPVPFLAPGGGSSGRSTPSRGHSNRNSYCATPDPTAQQQGFNRSTTSTPSVKQQHQEEGVPTKTPLFVAPLKDIAVVSGQPARFECIVACDATPSIRWTKDEAPIEEGYKFVPEYRNGVCRLSLPVAYEGDAGRYCCLAENHLGYAATCAELSVANSDWRANQ
uniref:Ig-like domain-containing protein n=1 Tax=Anopheles farauti TaxID=69004 RepID=A0A182QL10_9DIPT